MKYAREIIAKKIPAKAGIYYFLNVVGD